MHEFNSYHTFVVQTENRDHLKSALSKNNIETAIHYPIPIHLQPAANQLAYSAGDFPNTEKQAKTILTLPINQYLDRESQEFIIQKITQFFQNNENWY